jgi:Uma2 family endonuclease
MPRDFEAMLADVEYPTTDGKPMAETDLHRILMTSVIDRLAAYFAPREDVYVSGNLMVYYEEGEPRTFLAPDCFVAFGVKPGRRDFYKSWVEGKLPDVVFEFTSKSTKNDDLEEKYRIYQDVWRVKEYYLFDPRGEYLDPPLTGLSRTRGKFHAIPRVRGVYTSELLGLTLAADGSRLVLRDAATGRELLTEAELRVEAEQRAATAEAEIARLKAELAALRRKPTK